MRVPSISSHPISLLFVCRVTVTAAKFAVTRGQERQGKRPRPGHKAAEARARGRTRFALVRDASSSTGLKLPVSRFRHTSVLTVIIPFAKDASARKEIFKGDFL